MTVAADRPDGEVPTVALPPRFRRRPRAVLAGALEDVSPRRFLWIALGLFILLSLVIYWPQWPGATHSIVGCPCGDSMQEVWFLKWTPWAIAHGHNPLFTRWMDFPTGANLAANTSMPALALLMAPWTFLFGPVSSYNILMWASYPVSAIACSYVVRRLTSSNLGSLAAGLLYGFSPYVLGQGYGHAFLTFVPLPPLILYALYRIGVHQEGEARRWGVALAGLLLLQFFISEEIAVMTLIVAGLGALGLVLANRRALDRERWTYLRRAGVVALALVALVGAYPVAFQLFGPQAVHQAAHATTNSAFKLDLLVSVVPDHLQLIAPSFLARLANQFTGTDIIESGGYLGVALLVALGVIVWRRRGDRRIRFVAVMVVVCGILSMGRWLTVANHTLRIAMPWFLFARLPLLGTILASRFALLSSFFVALLVALGVEAWVTWAREPSASRHDRRRLRANVALGLLSVSAVALYLPAVPITTAPLPSVPAFFTSRDDLAIPAGGVVLPFPMTVTPEATAMYWQIRSDFRWRMIGGEAIIRTPKGHTTGRPADTRPTSVTQYLENLSGAATRRPVVNARLVSRMRQFLFLNDVAAVVLDPSAPNAPLALSLFSDVMGPPVSEGGVDLWLHAQTLARRHTGEGLN